MGNKYYDEGIRAYQRNDFAEAINYFDKEIYEKDNIMAHKYKGICLFELGEYEKALKILKQTYRKLAVNEIAYYIAFSHYNLGQFDDALLYINFAFQKKANNTPDFINYNYKNNGSPIITSFIEQKAQEIREKISNNNAPKILNHNGLKIIEEPIYIKRNPEEELSHYQKGVQFYNENKFELALEYFNKSLEYDENNYRALLKKAEVLFELDNFSESLDYFNKCLEIKQDMEALKYKAIILSIQNDPKSMDCINEVAKDAIKRNDLEKYSDILNLKGLIKSNLNSKIFKKKSLEISVNTNDQKALMEYYQKHPTQNNYSKNKKVTKYKRKAIPGALRHEVFKRDGYRCVECGASNKETTLHVDHILPVSQGGTNEISNLQTLCQKCNLAKSNRHWKGPQRY